MFEIVMGIDDFLIQLVKYCNKTEESEKSIYSQGTYQIPDGAKEYSRVTVRRSYSYFPLFLFD
ncbi:MAG TPA: hypothetical protein VFD03_03385 [Clostridia bacterium]|nr:hypothetical protein [Clostridia bacterium]